MQSPEERRSGQSHKRSKRKSVCTTAYKRALGECWTTQRGQGGLGAGLVLHFDPHSLVQYLPMIGAKVSIRGCQESQKRVACTRESIWVPSAFFSYFFFPTVNSFFFGPLLLFFSTLLHDCCPPDGNACSSGSQEFL